MLIENSPPHDYWDAGKSVWYPRCAALEAHVVPARRVTDEPGKPWAWWAGEVLDPIVGGGGDTWDTADLRGRASSRDAAEAAARAALEEVRS